MRAQLGPAAPGWIIYHLVMRFCFGLRPTRVLPMPETEAREQSRRGQVVWQDSGQGFYVEAYLSESTRYWMEGADADYQREKIRAEVEETLRSFLKDGL